MKMKYPVESFKCCTNGKGLYSARKEALEILNLEFIPEANEVRAYFDVKKWDVEPSEKELKSRPEGVDSGRGAENRELICSDPKFLEDFKKNMEKRGFGSVSELDYSEPLRQGIDYVSFTYGDKFEKSASKFFTDHGMTLQKITNVSAPQLW